MKVKCGHCTEEHDISHMEPVFALPDCIAAMTRLEAISKQVQVSKDICVFSDGIERRGFIRVLLPIPVHGQGVCRWGVWVEPTPYQSFRDIVERWSDPELLQVQRIALLANELHGYPGSLGAAGMVSFADMKSVGSIELIREQSWDASDPRDQQLVNDQRKARQQLVTDQHEGVPIERKLEWLIAAIHPSNKGSENGS